MTPQERDAMARKLGYRSFDEYKAKTERYQPGRSKIPAPKEPRNVMEKIPFHPASVLRKVSTTIDRAIKK